MRFYPQRSSPATADFLCRVPRSGFRLPRLALLLRPGGALSGSAWDLQRGSVARRKAGNSNFRKTEQDGRALPDNATLEPRMSFRRDCVST